MGKKKGRPSNMPRRKSFKQDQRLQSAKSWLPTYEGKNIFRGHRKCYGVDWPTAIEWTNVGLPERLQVLLAPQLDAFLDTGEHAVCHGGIALEEVIVPFVRISQETTA